MDRKTDRDPSYFINFFETLVPPVLRFLATLMIVCISDGIGSAFPTRTRTRQKNFDPNPDPNPTACRRADPTTRRHSTDRPDYDPTDPTSQQKWTAKIIFHRKPIFRTEIFLIVAQNCRFSLNTVILNIFLKFSSVFS